MSIELGRFNQLTIVKSVDFGLYLDGGEAGEILLPSRYVPEVYEIGEELNVFLYLDNEERLIATTLTPYAQVGDFAYLEVAWVNEYGAFLDWGLMKDLFVPFSEQRKNMVRGKKYLVYIYVDEESFRIVASAKLDKFLVEEFPPYQEGEEVSITIWHKTDLGFNAIIDNSYSGLLYDNEIFQPIYSGDQLTAFIKQVRPDGKIDLILQKPGQEHVREFSDVLYDYLKKEGGQIGLHDKSSADEIYEVFGVSKRVFKKAVGDLYKKRLIVLGKNSISLTK